MGCGGLGLRSGSVSLVVPPSPVYTRPLDRFAMSTNEDLAALLSRVALGDRAAFEQVYRASCAHLLGVAFRILNNRERAEEVLQEAFMNVWHSAGGFDASVAGPMTWLINIVRNKAIDALRSGKTERASTLALDEEAMPVAADATQQPQALLERSLEKLRIAECMGGLGASQRPGPGARLLPRLGAHGNRRGAGRAARHGQGLGAARPR